MVCLNGQELYRVNLPRARSQSNPERQRSSRETFQTLITRPTCPSPLFRPAQMLLPWKSTNILPARRASLSISNYSAMECTCAPTPLLRFRSGALQLAWPSNYTGFSLQSASNLGSGSEWQIVPGPYPLSNSTFEISVPINAGSAQFFRLIGPGQ